MMKNFNTYKWILTGWLSVVLFVMGPQVRVLAQQVDGKYTVKHPNGLLKERGFYKQGVKHKTWYYYSEAGLMERKEKWQKGVLVWQIFYSEKGKVTKTVDRNGKITVPPPCNCN
jgi:hypothetical protein